MHDKFQLVSDRSRADLLAVRFDKVALLARAILGQHDEDGQTARHVLGAFAAALADYVEAESPTTAEGWAHLLQTAVLASFNGRTVTRKDAGLVFTCIVMDKCKCIVFNVGTNRAILLSAGGSREILRPHSGEQRMLENGAAPNTARGFASIATDVADRAFTGDKLAHVILNLPTEGRLLILADPLISSQDLKCEFSDVGSLHEILERLKTERYAPGYGLSYIIADLGS